MDPDLLPEMREGGRGGGAGGDPDIKLLHLSASPAVTPDLQEPSAPLVFSRRLKNQQVHKDPAHKEAPGTGCGSRGVMSDRGHG